VNPTATPFGNIQQEILISQYLAFALVLGLAVLLAACNLYFYAPKYRKWVGLAAFSLGALGSAICIGDYGLFKERIGFSPDSYNAYSSSESIDG